MERWKFTADSLQKWTYERSGNFYMATDYQIIATNTYRKAWDGWGK